MTDSANSIRNRITWVSVGFGLLIYLIARQGFELEFWMAVVIQIICQIAFHVSILHYHYRLGNLP